jgi:hypothetical protein
MSEFSSTKRKINYNILFSTYLGNSVLALNERQNAFLLDWRGVLKTVTIDAS